MGLFLITRVQNGQTTYMVRQLTIAEQFKVQGIPLQIMHEVIRTGGSKRQLRQLCGNTVAHRTAERFMGRSMRRLDVLKEAVKLKHAGINPFSQNNFTVEGDRREWALFSFGMSGSVETTTQATMQTPTLPLEQQAVSQVVSMDNEVTQASVVAVTMDDRIVMCKYGLKDGRTCVALPGGPCGSKGIPAEAAMRAWNQVDHRGELGVTEAELRRSDYMDVNNTRYYTIFLQHKSNETNNILMKRSMAEQSDQSATEKGVNAQAVTTAEVWNSEGVQLGESKCDAIHLKDWKVMTHFEETQKEPVAIQLSYVRRLNWCKQHHAYSQYDMTSTAWMPEVQSDCTGDETEVVTPTWEASHLQSISQLISRMERPGRQTCNVMGTDGGVETVKFDTLWQGNAPNEVSAEVGKQVLEQSDILLPDGQVLVEQTIPVMEGTDQTVVVPAAIAKSNQTKGMERKDAIPLATEPLSTETQTKKVRVRKPRGMRHVGDVTCEYEVWHGKLSHANAQPICDPRLGLSFAPGKKGGTCKCKTCEMSKINRGPMGDIGVENRWFVVAKDRVDKAIRPESCWNIDLSGPFIASRHGKYRYVIVISSPCGMIFTQFTQTRHASNLCAALLKVLCILPPDTMLHLQSDHEGGIISKEFSAICESNGITAMSTPRASSELNSTAERGIQTLKKLTICNLTAAGCGSTWWPLPMAYAAVCQSRLILGDNRMSGMRAALNYEMPLHRFHI